MIANGSLTIRGHGMRRVPNHFYRQKVASDALCILFGGWHYTTDMPLFYHTRRIFIGLGYDVLAVDFQYSASRRYAQLPDRKRQEWFLEEVRAAFQAANRDKYRRVVLGAKGISTLALADLIIDGLTPPETTFLWLSPLLEAESIRETLATCPHPSLVVMGKRDPQYAAPLAKKLAANKNLRIKLIDKVDEDLELAGDVAGSIRIQSRYIEELRQFIGIAADRKRTTTRRRSTKK